MAQGISVYCKSKLIYHTFHEENGKYLERECEPEDFSILKDIDDSDPSSFSEVETLIALIDDLDIVIQEAEIKKDYELSNHLKEVMVLCRLCLWNLGEYTLIISPYEYIPKSEHPPSLPTKYESNIALAGIFKI